MTSRVITAPWIVTGDPAQEPIRDGAVVIGPEDDVIAVGRAADAAGHRGQLPFEELRAVLVPGLINAHTHLELSALRDRVPGGHGFVPWASAMLQRRAELSPEDDAGAIRAAIAELAAFGTVAVGEVTNSLASWGALCSSGIAARVFVEVFGLRRETAEVMLGIARQAIADAGDPPRREGLGLSLAPHTPFSLHPDVLRGIVAETRAPHGRTSLHLCEHAAERAYLRDGSGALPGFFAARGADATDWAVPGVDPIEHVRRLGVLGPSLIAVHLADVRPRELAAIAESGTRVVLCPRSNLFIEGRPPPLADILAAGIRPGLGTDSLASNADLDVLREAAELGARFREVPARVLLAMATRWGAEALGMYGAGTIAAEARPGVLAVPIEGATPDDPAAWLLADVARPRRRVAAAAPTLVPRSSPMPGRSR